MALLGEALGCCCAYLKIIGESTHSIMILFANLEGTIWNSPKVYSLIASGIVTIFAFKKNVAGLSNISFLGNFAVMIFMICCVILFIFKLIAGQIKPLTQSLFYHSFTFKEAYMVFSTMLEAFLFQTMTFSIYCSLKKRENKNMLKVSTYGVSLVGVIYASIGILCYLMYGDNTTESVFGMFRSEIIMLKEKNNTLIVGTLVLALGCLLFNAMLSFPIQFFVVKNSVFGILVMMKQCNYPNPEALVELEELDKNGNIIEKENQLNELDEEEEKEKKYRAVYRLSEYSKVILTIVMLISITLSAISIKQLISICNAVGSTCGNFIILLGPGAFCVILTKARWFSFKKLFQKFMVILGIIIFGLYFNYEVLSHNTS